MQDLLSSFSVEVNNFIPNDIPYSLSGAKTFKAVFKSFFFLSGKYHTVCVVDEDLQEKSLNPDTTSFNGAITKYDLICSFHKLTIINF